MQAGSEVLFLHCFNIRINIMFIITINTLINMLVDRILSGYMAMVGVCCRFPKLSSSSPSAQLRLHFPASLAVTYGHVTRHTNGTGVGEVCAASVSLG